jgi:hypothetical protein
VSSGRRRFEYKDRIYYFGDDGNWYVQRPDETWRVLRPSEVASLLEEIMRDFCVNVTLITAV